MKRHDPVPPPVETPVADLAPGHAAIVVTRGALPGGAAWYFSAADHTLVIAERLPLHHIGDAVSAFLASAADPQAARPASELRVDRHAVG